MKSLLMFAAGILARAISTVAQAYANWLLYKVAGGMSGGTGFVNDLLLFLHGLLQEIAAEICGRRAPVGTYDEDEYGERGRWR